MKPERFKNGEYDGWLYDADEIDTYHSQEIAKKDEEIRELRDALEELMTEQNGPPLIKHKDDWKSAMDKAEQALAKKGGE